MDAYSKTNAGIIRLTRLATDRIAFGLYTEIANGSLLIRLLLKAPETSAIISLLTTAGLIDESVV
ncbi:hypothetical protein BWI93_14205 [Siphonobacter sp. BAB-5385]|uniref:hypothetical protein n=1 Tax=unclassified Siphonobacter TaxID=2635712 RepID=UPI000B9ED1D0|nr:MULTISPECIES: hypothetical protein [unclassified Siphonobacter]OZI07491.1 hypothetical protein BWI93_14205 [Siphonobacter sp. BAB-5385]PMD98389.1 hypothetical protein BWI97_04305 [Siphonobacter sp. BAB-5405]